MNLAASAKTPLKHLQVLAVTKSCITSVGAKLRNLFACKPVALIITLASQFNASLMARHSESQHQNYRSVLNHTYTSSDFSLINLEGNNDKFCCQGSAWNPKSHFDNHFLALQTLLWRIV